MDIEAPSAKMVAVLSGGERAIEVVNTTENCRLAFEVLSDLEGPFAIDLEGVELGRAGELSLVQVASQYSGPVYLFDVVELGASLFEEGLKQLLEDERRVKLFYDVRADVAIMFHQYGVHVENTCDLQILYCSATAPQSDVLRYLRNPQKEYLTGLERAMQDLDLSRTEKESLQAIKQAGRELLRCSQKQGAVWGVRPLDAALQQYAANDVLALFSIHKKYRHSMPEATLAALSKQRVAGQERKIQEKAQVRLLSAQMDDSVGIAVQQLPGSPTCWLVRLDTGREVETLETDMEFVAAHSDAVRDFPLPMERRTIVVEHIGANPAERWQEAVEKQCGKILSFVELKGGLAVIEFEHSDGASAAIMGEDNLHIGDRSLPVRVNWLNSAQRYCPQYLRYPVNTVGATEKRFMGCIKFYNSDKGFGFICSPMFSGDVFLHSSQGEDCRMGQRVTFAVVHDSFGRPQAKSVREIPTTQFFEGSIKALSPEMGGLVQCSELAYVFCQDVVLPAKEAVARHVGEEIAFMMFVNPEGQPQALSVSPISSPHSHQCFVGYMNSWAHQPPIFPSSAFPWPQEELLVVHDMKDESSSVSTDFVEQEDLSNFDSDDCSHRCQECRNTKAVDECVSCWLDFVEQRIDLMSDGDATAVPADEALG